MSEKPLDAMVPGGRVKSSRWLVWTALVAVLLVAAALCFLFRAPNSGSQAYYLHAYILNSQGRDQDYISLTPPDGFSGIWRTWDRYGNIRTVEQWSNGKISGSISYYGKCGVKLEESYCTNNMPDGPSLYWNEQGLLKRIAVHKQGKAITIASFWPAGHMKDEYHFRADRRHGLSQRWNEDGELTAVELWKDGKCVDASLLTKLDLGSRSESGPEGERSGSSLE